jgi:Xaa-Pro aminopeptidase
VADRGYTFTHGLGHQVGRTVHDGGVMMGPDNARYADRSRGVIEAGMVLTLEPVVGSAMIEEDVVVTETGCEFLVPPQREIYLVG